LHRVSSMASFMAIVLSYYVESEVNKTYLFNTFPGVPSGFPVLAKHLFGLLPHGQEDVIPVRIDAHDKRKVR